MSQSTQAALTINSIISGQAFGATGAVTTTPAGAAACKTVQSIATSSTQIVLEVTGSPAYLFILNDDPTNYVQVDANSSFNGFPQTIQPGGFILLSPGTATVYAKANTSPVIITVLALPA
jgi:hypothetical protein